MSAYDVIIIGGGPIGLACGIEARKRGFSHLILEKGCLVNSVFHFPTNMTFFSTSERLEIGDVPFISHGEKPTRREALEYYRRVTAHWNLNVHTYEAAKKLQGQFPEFVVESEHATYSAKAVIVATGFYDQPNLLHVPGEDLPKVKHYYDEPHPYVFQHVAVIGGGNSAVDVALETFRRGAASVTMIVREPALKSTIKYWVRPDIENRIKEGSIKAYFNSEVVEIRPNEIDVRTPKGMLTLRNDFVLAMTGYHPNYDLLEVFRITFTNDAARRPIYNPDTMEIEQPGVFLAGVVCGGMETNKWTIENARDHAPKIMDALAQKL